MLDDIDSFSPRAQAFLRELEVLSAKHKIQITVSGYDGLVLCDREGDEPAIYSAGIDDRVS